MKRFDTLFNEPVISKDKIDGHKDFAGLMAKYKHHQHQYRKTNPYKKIIGGLVLLLTISALWFVLDYQHSKEDLPVQKQPLQQHTEAAKPKGEEPAAGDATPKEQQGAGKDESPSVVHVEESREEVSPGKTDRKNDREQKKPIMAEKKKEASDGEQALIYTEASPKKGLESLQEYFNENLEYPEEEFLADKEGVVIVSFVINTVGKAEEIRIMHAVSPGIDQEATRLIREMPAWKPADVNGQAVISRVNLPVTFKLTDYEKY